MVSAYILWHYIQAKVQLKILADLPPGKEPQLGSTLIYGSNCSSSLKGILTVVEAIAVGYLLTYLRRIVRRIMVVGGPQDLVDHQILEQPEIIW